MSEFGDELKALRIMLAEQGTEVTLEKLAEVLDRNMGNRAGGQQCPDCRVADLGLCFACLMRLVRE